MSLFPVPVTGQKIPSGWFGRLVRFINSLVLRGDGSYLSVTHTPEGTLIKPTPYLIEQLTKSGGAPAAAGGAAQDISASVTGGTATITLSGSTSAVQLIGTGDVTISGNTSGQIEINVASGTASPIGFPNYGIELVAQESMEYNTTYGPFAQNAYLIGEVMAIIDGEERGNLSVFLTGGTISKTVHLFDVYREGQTASDILGVPIMLPIPAGISFQLRAVTDEANIDNLAVYPAL